MIAPTLHTERLTLRMLRMADFAVYDGHTQLGYATEAATAVRDWAFASLGLTTLVSYIDPDNFPSRRVAEHLGATLDPNAARPDPTDLVYRHRGTP
jgi:RimJ/RimL family protein N-acetyltransferase